MRISTGYQYNSYRNAILGAQERLSIAQNEVMTGKRDNLAVNDAGGFVQVLRAGSLKAATDQYDKNLRTAKDYFSFTEQAATDANDLFKRAYTLALQGANSTADQASRDALANEISTLQKRLVDMANTKGASGQYVFAGQMTNQAPFSVSGTSLTYNGDTNAVIVETAANQTMQVNTVANTTFTNAYARLEQLKNNLLGGNISGISGADVPALQSSMNDFKSIVGQMGANLNQVQEIGTTNTRRLDELTKKISDIQDVDMAEAITNYQLAQTAYSAALTVASQNQRLSLMDYIR